MPRFALLACLTLSILALAAPSALAQSATEGEHSANMEFVKNLPYELRNGATEIVGTDIEFARIGGRQYALAGSYVHPREQVMTAAFYNGGVRVVDLSGLTGISLGGTQVAGEGMREIGYYRMPDADTWWAKTPQIDRKTGDFYLFGNDIKRGLDVYDFDGGGKKPKSRGRWMTAGEARIALADRPAPGTAGTTYVCLLDG
jgi:hypothetical protein